jgi:hypothetical protein
MHGAPLILPKLIVKVRRRAFYIRAAGLQRNLEAAPFGKKICIALRIVQHEGLTEASRMLRESGALHPTGPKPCLKKLRLSANMQKHDLLGTCPASLLG